MPVDVRAMWQVACERVRLVPISIKQPAVEASVRDVLEHLRGQEGEAGAIRVAATQRFGKFRVAVEHEILRASWFLMTSNETLLSTSETTFASNSTANSRR